MNDRLTLPAGDRGTPPTDRPARPAGDHALEHA